jgi:hypothetical protein
MTIAEIAVAAVSILSPYLVKIGEELGKKAAGAAWTKVEEIHQSIKARFAKEKDDHATKTLARFEEKPESRKAGMQEALEEILTSDPEFASSLLSLLKEAEQAHAGDVFNVEFHINVSGHGKIGKVVNIGGNVKGDVKI